jgi:hypothetical protein
VLPISCGDLDGAMLHVICYLSFAYSSLFYLPVAGLLLASDSYVLQRRLLILETNPQLITRFSFYFGIWISFVDLDFIKWLVMIQFKRKTYN